jgi:hypothetical protein
MASAWNSRRLSRATDSRRNGSNWRETSPNQQYPTAVVAEHLESKSKEYVELNPACLANFYYSGMA